jgi:lysophospholipase L1-like esterase
MPYFGDRPYWYLRDRARGLGLSSPSKGVGYQVEDRAMAGWGDSLTEAVAGWVAKINAEPGWITYNGGVAGETSGEILDRVLADTTHRRWTSVFWMGRNDFYVEPNFIIANIAAAVSYIGHPRYLVLSILPSRTDTTGTGNRDKINALNATLASTYGSRFVDLIPVLCTDTGDVMPTSIAPDGLHLNDGGHTLVADTVLPALLALPATSPQDATPDAFAFTAGTNLEPSAVTLSNQVTITGIGGETAISVTGCEYSINGGAYTSTSGTILNGDTLRLRATSDADTGDTKTVSVTVGTVTQSWSLTTTTAPNLVLDPAFDDASKWSGTAGAAVTGGQCVFTSTNFGSLSQIASVAFEAGASYRVTYDIVSISGQVRAQFNGGSAKGGVTRTAPGSYSETIVANSGNNQIRLQTNTSSTSAVVDNLTCRRL